MLSLIPYSGRSTSSSLFVVYFPGHFRPPYVPFPSMKTDSEIQSWGTPGLPSERRLRTFQPLLSKYSTEDVTWLYHRDEILTDP